MEAVWTNRKAATGTKHLLDKARATFGGTRPAGYAPAVHPDNIDGTGSHSKAQVEGVKLVTRLTPFLAMMIPFWGIYSQMSTAFQNQVGRSHGLASSSSLVCSLSPPLTTVSPLRAVKWTSASEEPLCRCRPSTASTPSPSSSSSQSSTDS